MTIHATACAGLVCVLAVARPAAAHDGPPFPIVNDRLAGDYTVAVWTDPDTTEDGTAAGRFWVVLTSADGTALSSSPRTTITATPLGPRPIAQTAAATATGDGRTQYAAVVLDREGPYRIDVRITGAGGDVNMTAVADATYDRRPSRLVALLYLVPFLLAGLLWMKVLLRRFGRLAPGSGLRNSTDRRPEPSGGPSGVRRRVSAMERHGHS